MQTINPQMTAMVHAFGAKATPISPTEVFEALEKGVIDATIQSVGKYTEAKLFPPLTTWLPSQMIGR